VISDGTVPETDIRLTGSMMVADWAGSMMVTNWTAQLEA
jgi:hypothetical protein